jgi:hypothetical protein
MIVQLILPPTWEYGESMEFAEACTYLGEPHADACFDRDVAPTLELPTGTKVTEGAYLQLWGWVYWTRWALTPNTWVPMRLFYGHRYKKSYIASWCPIHDRWVKVPNIEARLGTVASIIARGAFAIFNRETGKCPCRPR